MSKVVVGVDGSEESWKAFDAAVRIAQASDGSVVAVHAEHLTAWASLGVGSTLGDVFAADAELREKLMAEVTERSKEVGVEITSTTHKGRPAQALIDEAKSCGADMIVVGHRGHGGAMSWVGSVANEVVHRSPISVYVVR